MNKLVITLALLLGVSITSHAQYSYNSHEISFGVIAPVLKTAIVSYEMSLTDAHSLGLQVVKNLSENSGEYDDTYELFSLTPFYRYYPSDNEARGMFLEGFAKYEKKKTTGIEEDPETNSYAGLGVGAGYKKVTSFGLLFGLNLGAGYGFSLQENVDGKMLGRGSLFVGWRF